MIEVRDIDDACIRRLSATVSVRVRLGRLVRLPKEYLEVAVGAEVELVWTALRAMSVSGAE